MNNWIKGGYEAMLTKKMDGRPPKLNKEQKKKLKKLLIKRNYMKLKRYLNHKVILLYTNKTDKGGKDDIWSLKTVF